MMVTMVAVGFGDYHVLAVNLVQGSILASQASGVMSRPSYVYFSKLGSLFRSSI